MSAGAALAERHASALALCRARRFTEAAELFAAVAREQPGLGAPLLDQARASRLAGQTQRAQDLCRRALACDPTMLRGHLLLAAIAKRRGNLQATIAALRQAVALRPQAASLRARIAELLAERGQTDAAMNTARAALARDPNCHAASLVLLRCHAARGDEEQARRLASRLDLLRPGWAALQPFLGPPAPAEAALLTDLALPPVTTVPLAEPVQAPPRRRATLPPRGPTLLDDLRIVQALMLRNLQLRYGNNPLGLPLEVLRPIAVVVAHWALFSLLHKPMPGQIPIPLFVLAGFSVWFAFNYTAVGSANGANTPGGATLLPGVSTMHLRLARGAWPLLVNLVFCIGAVLPLRLFGVVLPLPALPRTVEVFALAGCLGLGFGLLFDRLGAVSPFARPIEKLMSWGLFVTSGLYFVVYHAMPAVAGVLLWNPVLHLVEFERNAFDPGYPLALVDLRYPAVLAAGLLLLGLAACRAIRAPA